MKILGYSGNFPLNDVITSLKINLELQSDEARKIALDIKSGKVVDLEYDIVLAEDFKDFGIYID